MEPPGAVASGAVLGNVIILDVDGSVIFNAKEEEARKRQAEVERLQRVAERLLKCRDDHPLRAMQLSFGKACADPSDELIHLYEIKDTAASIFREKADACRELGVAEDAWDTFHKICNDFPLTQGRHRGSKYAELRQATHEELKFARQFARDIIVGYIAYIERERTRQ